MSEDNLKTGFDEEEEIEFVEEDQQVIEIEKLEKPEEIEAAMEILEEELDEISEPFLNEDTSQTADEPDKLDHSDKKDTSDADKTTDQDPDKQKADEIDEAKKAEIEAGKKADEDFILTDEIIAKQPEENRAILEKYKGKGKAELEKAIANAVMTKSNKDVVQALIDTQKDVGKADSSSIDTLKEKDGGDDEIIPKELPPLPEDNEEITNAINSRIIRKIRAAGYADVPDDMNSTEFKEYVRDLTDDDFRKAKKFTDLLEKTEVDEKASAQRFLYIKDNYRKVNNSLLIKEVEAIKSELKKLGVDDPKDIGVDLTLTKDEKGSYYNQSINNLLLDGDQADENVIKFIGPVPILKTGKLAKKFLAEHIPQTISYLVSKNNKTKEKEIETLKSKNLNTLGSSSSSGHKTETISVSEIQKIKDPDLLAKKMQEIEDSL